MTDPIDNEKRALRADLRERRQHISPTARAKAEAALDQQLSALVDRFQARTVSCFLSSSTEPPTRQFLRGALQRGIRVLLPISRADGLLDWVAAEPDKGDVEGLFGVPEQEGDILPPMAVNDVDLMLIPAAAVDRRGARLGWGRGYFDKTLGSMQRRPPAYAVIFDSELLDAVPSDVHDQPVSGAVTPSRIVDFGETPSRTTA